MIDKIAPLPSLRKLKILSLGRNNIRKIEKLDDLAGSLEQLWLSYNQIDKLEGLSALRNLQVLYLSNNKIKSFDELLRLKDLPRVCAFIDCFPTFCYNLVYVLTTPLSSPTVTRASPRRQPHVRGSHKAGVPQ
jgi:Leucine-rich repeat (LRR) protein